MSNTRHPPAPPATDTQIWRLHALYPKMDLGRMSIAAAAHLIDAREIVENRTKQSHEPTASRKEVARLLALRPDLKYAPWPSKRLCQALIDDEAALSDHSSPTAHTDARAVAGAEKPCPASTEKPSCGCAPRRTGSRVTV